MQETLGWIERLVAAGQPEYLITSNLNYAMLAARDAELMEITRRAAGVLADGMPIVMRSRFGKEPRLPERVAGSELIYHLAELAARKSWGIYFLGAAPGVARACADKLVERSPGLRIAGVESPPFRALSTEELEAQRERIRASRPEILLVAMGQPKGERWIAQHYRTLGVPVSIQLGASFDFVAGRVKRAPLGWQRVGLEWAYRMCSDPMRLVPRYASNAAFLCRAVLRELNPIGLRRWPSA